MGNGGSRPTNVGEMCMVCSVVEGVKLELKVNDWHFYKDR